jgi:hypothetical protein
VTRLLLERGEQGGVQAIRPTLQQSLAARLDRLGPAREFAQIGAVLGRDFTYALLSALGEIDDLALQSALDRLAGADLLIAEGVGPSPVRTVLGVHRRRSYCLGHDRPPLGQSNRAMMM